MRGNAYRLEMILSTSCCLCFGGRTILDNPSGSLKAESFERRVLTHGAAEGGI